MPSRRLSRIHDHNMQCTYFDKHNANCEANTEVVAMRPFHRQHHEGDEEEERHNERGDVDPICDFCTLLKACDFVRMCRCLAPAKCHTI
jgi:hypothetical protein